MQYRNTFLISTSLYALAVAFAPRSLADCPIGNTGDVTTTGLCTSPQNLTNAIGTVISGAQLIVSSGVAYSINGTGSTFTNSGIITGTSPSVEMGGSGNVLIDLGIVENVVSLPDPFAIQISGTNEAGITIGSAGLVELDSANGETAIEYVGPGPGINTALDGNFVNAGTIDSSGTVINFNQGSISGNFINSGLIQATDASGVVAVNLNGGIGGTFDNEAGGLITASGAGVDISDGNIGGDLINDGAIKSLDFDIEMNSGTLAGNFINSGTLKSSDQGALLNIVTGNVINSGLIGAHIGGIEALYVGGDLLNSGTITGQDGSLSVGDGIDISDAVGGNFTNTGTVLVDGTAVSLGIAGTSAVDSISNSGLLSGSTGVRVSGTINGSFENLNGGIIDGRSGVGVSAGAITGDFINAGTIEGSPAIELSEPVLGGLTNSTTGVISSSGFAIILDAGGGVQTIQNEGIISSVSDSAIFSDGGGVNLTNAGVISGGTLSGSVEPAIAFQNADAASTITLLSGTVTGGIILPGTGLADIINIDGGTLTGDIDDDFHGTSSGTVNFSLAPSAVFTISSIADSNNESVDVDAVNMYSGTIVMNGRISAPAGVENEGAVLETGVPGIINDGESAVITGNYTQGISGTLLEEVTDTYNRLNYLNVNGVASLDGKLELYFDPGNYSALAGHTEPVVNATALSGTFSSVADAPGSATPQSYKVTYTKTTSDLTFAGSALPPSVTPPPTPPNLVAPQNATIFPELASVAIIDADHAVDTILNHAGSPPSSSGLAQLTFNGVSNPLGASHGGRGQLAKLGDVIPQVYAAYGAWIEASGNFLNVRSGNGAPGYHAQTGGFLAGLSNYVTPNVSLGLSVGYDHFNLTEDHSHASGTDDIGRLALYGAYDLGQATISAVGALGYDSFATTRPLIVGTAKESHEALEGDFGLKLSQNLQLGTLQLVPSTGFDYANLPENSFSETGASGADLDGHPHSTSSLQPFIGVAVGQYFGVDHWFFNPSAHVTWHYEALETQRSLIVAAQDDTLFNISGVSIAREYLDAGIGLSAQAGPNVQVFGAYDVSVGFGFGLDQSVLAGLKYYF